MIKSGVLQEFINEFQSEEAQIHFSLLVAPLVQFDIFDTLGRKVKTMQDYFTSVKQIWTIEANELTKAG